MPLYPLSHFKNAFTNIIQIMRKTILIIAVFTLYLPAYAQVKTEVVKKQSYEEPELKRISTHQDTTAKLLEDKNIILKPELKRTHKYEGVNDNLQRNQHLEKTVEPSLERIIINEQVNKLSEYKDSDNFTLFTNSILCS